MKYRQHFVDHKKISKFINDRTKMTASYSFCKSDSKTRVDSFPVIKIFLKCLRNNIKRFHKK